MWDKRPDTVVHEEEPYNAEPSAEALSESALTPIEVFYSRNHGPVPEVDPDTWRLEVDGLVEHARTLSLQDLRQGFEPHEVVATMQCAGNRRAGFLDVAEIPGEDAWRGGAIGVARWGGVRLRDVLALARPASGASDVCFTAPDVSQIPDPPQAYGSSVGLVKAMTPDVLVAWEMNGEPLPRVHGGPVRIVVPGYIGARSVKWVDGIHVGSRPSDNYFQETAYRILGPDADPATARAGDGISLGPSGLNCEILHPSAPPGGRAAIVAGPCRVAGYAVAAEGRRVARVEVSTDTGDTWTDARLEQPDGAWAWTRWHLDVDLPAGLTTVVARAWDDTGAQQPRDPADLWNPKGYANTSWPRVDVEAARAPGR